MNHSNLRFSSTINKPNVIKIKLFKLFVNLFSLRDRPFEKQLEVLIILIVFFIVVLFTSLISLIQTAFSLNEVISMIKQGIVPVNFIVDSTGLLSVFIWFAFSFIFFLLSKKFLFFVNSICIGIVVHGLFFNLWIKRSLGMLEGAGVFQIALPVVITISISSTKWYNIAVWALNFISCVIISLIKDLIFNSKDNVVSFYLERKEHTGRINSVFLYIQTFLLTSIFGVLLMRARVLKKGMENVLRDVSESISKMEFNHSNFKKILNKSPQYSTQFDRVIQSMICNLSIYRGYLPDEIKMNFDSLPKTESKTSSNLSSRDSGRSLSGSNDTCSSYSKYSEKRSNNSSGSFGDNTKRSIEYSLKNSTSPVVLMNIKICKFKEMIQVQKIEYIQEVLETFMDITLKSIYSGNGIVNDITFFGGEIHASYNAVRRSLLSLKKAVQAGHNIVSNFRKKFPNLKIRINILEDIPIIGNIKTEQKTKFFILCREYEMNEIDHINKKTCNSLVPILVVGPSTYESLKYEVQLKQVGIVGGKKVYRPLKKINQRERCNTNEWYNNIETMIQKEDFHLSENTKSINEIWEKIGNKSRREIQKLVNIHVSKFPDDVDGKYLLEKMFKNEYNSV